VGLNATDTRKRNSCERFSRQQAQPPPRTSRCFKMSNRQIPGPQLRAMLKARSKRIPRVDDMNTWSERFGGSYHRRLRASGGFCPGLSSPRHGPDRRPQSRAARALARAEAEHKVRAVAVAVDLARADAVQIVAPKRVVGLSVRVARQRGFGLFSHFAGRTRPSWRT
jgi:hypothetical protein